MGFSDYWQHVEDDVRLTVRANTVDFVVYINWVAETVREKSVHHSGPFGWPSWNTWEKEGEPIPIGVMFQLDTGTIPPPGMSNPMGPFISSSTGEDGYRNVGFYQIAMTMTFPEGGNPSVGRAAGLVNSINAMKVNFTFNGKEEQLEIGANWLTKAVSVVVIVVIVFVILVLLGVYVFA